MVERLKVTQTKSGSWAVLADGSRLPMGSLTRKEAITRAITEARESDNHPMVYVESFTGAIQPRVI